MYSMFDSTVAAVSTPHGKGGIAVIRVSGCDAIAVCQKFAYPKNGKLLSAMPAGTVALCRVLDSEGETLDEAVVTVYHAPRSYTGEDIVEISCHGGILLTEAVLSRAFECGASPAGPGEFTRRAFSAGKLSLSQAEAVIGMIDAQTRAALSLSRANLDGAVRRGTDTIYEMLKAIVSGVYAAIDFPDEDLSSISGDEIRSEIKNTIAALGKLRDSYKTGHAVCEGVQTVIFGKPNTGKSTILNLLAGHERAIVTDVAGTTRDIISETVTAGRVTLRLSDTAGVHNTSDAVERIGVQKSLEALDGAELVLAVFNASAPLDAEDKEVLSHLKKRTVGGVSILPILNKSDLGICADTAEIESILGVPPLLLCAKEETGRALLTERIEKAFINGDFAAGDTVITNARQAAALSEALLHTQNALATLDALGADTACTELELAMGALGEVDGRQVTVDVVDSIFHRFCVGK